MAFTNTTISTPNPKAEEKKLKERLSFLGKKMDEAEVNAASYKNIISKKEQAEKELAGLEIELQSVKDNLTLKLALTSTQNTLLSATEEFETLLHSVEQKQKEFSELNVVTDVKQKQVVSLGNQVVSFEEKLTALKTAINEEEEKIKHILEAEKLKITEREGNLTLRESWLKEKEESLRKFHGELEKFFGKKININV